MKTRNQKIHAIVTALNSYSPIEAPEIVTATVSGLSDEEIATLYGITGCFIHAVTGKPPMPAKWQKQLHEDLLDCFCHFSQQAHERRGKAKGGAL